MARPVFDAAIIHDLRLRVISHNEAHPDAKTKLAELRKLYERGFRGSTPGLRAMSRVDAHLASLAQGGAGTEPADTPPRSAPAPQARELRPLIRMTGILSADDFGAALEVAGIDARPGAEALVKAAQSVALIAQGVVSAQHSPGIGEIRHVGEVLGEIEQACLASLQAILTQMTETIPEENGLQALARALSRTRDPVVIALLGALGAPDDKKPEGRSLALAQMLSAVDTLRFCAQAAAAQYASGVASQKRSRACPAARSPARELGLALIQSYVLLTGKAPSFSRKPPGSEGAGEPTGRLVHLSGEGPP